MLKGGYRTEQPRGAYRDVGSAVLSGGGRLLGHLQEGDYNRIDEGDGFENTKHQSRGERVGVQLCSSKLLGLRGLISMYGDDSVPVDSVS